MVLASDKIILAPFIFIVLFFSHSLFAQTNGGMDHQSAAGYPPPFDWHSDAGSAATNVSNEIIGVSVLYFNLTITLESLHSAKDKIHVYPNPLRVGDMLMVQYGSEIAASIMQIVDSSGKIVSTKYNVPCKGGVSGMLTDGLVPGAYNILIDEKHYARFMITN